MTTRNPKCVLSAMAVAMLFATGAGGAVLFTETFDDLNAWMVEDADGAGTATVIETVDGKLHVKNDLTTAPTDHGLYAGQVLPADNARVYFWGLNAVGSRSAGQTFNSPGPVGTFNVSTIDGVVNAFDGGSVETPVGVYVRNRDVGGWITEAQRIINEDNAFSSDPDIAEGVSHDFYIEYAAGAATHFMKLSSSNTWNQIDGSAAITLSGSGLYLNISSWGAVDPPGGSGEGANWTLEQIDITTSDHEILTGPEVIVPNISNVVVEATAGIGFTSEADFTYRLQSTPDLVSSNFTDTGAFVIGSGGDMILFDPTGTSTSKNYRVVR